MLWYNLFKKSVPAATTEPALRPIKKLHKKGVINLKQYATIANVLTCGALCARDVMIPRVDVLAIELRVTAKQLNKHIANATHSRFPVYNGGIDNIKGILHIKDIFSYLYEKGTKKAKTTQLKKYLTQPFFIPESREVFDILKDFQQKRQQMAVVVDEYGGFSGIVTMEDILEEFIGDIKDESDNEKESVIKLDEHKFSLDARADLETINDLTGTTLISEKAETIGGFIINLLGYVPKLGEIISHKNMHFKIKQKRGNSLIRISLKLNPPSPAGEKKQKP